VTTKARIAVFPGDGIGPEVTAEAVAVLELVAPRHGLSLELSSGTIGGGAIDATGDPLPPAELARAQASDAILLGAVGGPRWDDPKAAVRPEQALLRLRKGLGVYANLRPVWTVPALVASSPLKPEVLEGVDLVVVRELTGGIYFGQPSERRRGPAGREAVDTCVYTEEEIVRLLHASFALARQRRKKLTSVDKANILATSRLWREIATEIAAGYPDVAFENVLVDAMAMHLIRRPRDFDVVATENLFGDIDAGGVDGHAAVGVARGRARAGRAMPRPLRADPRQRARHRRPGYRESAGGDPLGRHVVSVLARLRSGGGGDRARGRGGRGGRAPHPRSRATG
jgi:3-isopropylmalate dehydrogenase